MNDNHNNVNSIHQFKTQGIDGTEINFKNYEGRKILVVNVASECGLTPQYAQLQELYESFHDKLVIVGFPANNFGGQEPGTNGEIQTFCTKNYGVTFPLAAKIDIETHPIYRWLTDKNLNGFEDSTVEWNFQKYLMNESGQLVKVFSPSVIPIDEIVLDAVNS